MRLIDVVVPPVVVRPWSVLDEVDQRKEILQFVLYGRTCQAPTDLASEIVDSFSNLNNSAFDIVCLIQYDSEPVVPIQSLVAYVVAH